MLKLNVGISRKVGEANYGSRGASLHLELELDSRSIEQPDKLQDRIRRLYAMARQAVEEELQGQNGHQGTNGNGRHESSAPRATAAQLRAVRAIADRQRLDLPSLLREQYGAASPDELTLPQASRWIDELKARAAAGGGG